MSGEVDAVAVVVPAHDEAATVEACVRSVIAAARRSRLRLPVSVCVVADRCTDGTERLARDAGDGFDRFATVPRARPRPLGDVRNLGVRCARALLPRVRAERLWLLHTDADGTVPVTWIDDHLRHAFDGADAVAGRADVQDYSAITVRAQHRYQEHVRRGEDRFTHSHVYGANLGVRADVFRAVGGFPEVFTGEDHGLWLKLAEAGAAVRQPNDVRVRTSGRTRGRAPGGLAALLRTLTCEGTISSPR
ncbi:glycosyltransferase [Saccharopolyspora gloriosae]|uniref:4,4'-diaponeurosporenoate glycosyltransferase n=1 Tax=Saccharopolyspora gloriosae TaxID=455344 RepID=A0A840N8R7_9PSEU|nr:glycosyltransferase [Saccharopolyspora gloriosae]MBB5068360.1 glycosyltransferase involved in cell wall biosynthesis [Saccharopolyspora gloriosae]